MSSEPKKSLSLKEARRAAIGFVLLTGLFAFVLYPYFRPAPARLAVANVPDFELELISGGSPGDRVRRVDLADKLLILDFWASWCAPCRGQTTNLIQAHPKLAERATVLGIATGEPIEAAKKYALESGTPYSNAYDDEGLLARALSVSTLPTLLIVDNTGRILAATTKQLSAEEIVGLLDTAVESAEN